MVCRFLLAMSLIASGCTAESSPEGGSGSGLSGNHRPVIREATISPSPLVRETAISVQIHADDQDRDTLTFHHQWMANGHPLNGQTSPTLSPDFLRQGDSVSVEIVPDDGKERGATYRTAAVTVMNTPPIISSLSIRPQPAKPGDRLEAFAEADDPDRDRFELSFRWWRNATVAKEGDGAILDTTGFSLTDVVTVEVTPRDRTSVGRPVKSEPLALGNSPPTILSTPPAPVGRERYEYVVKAIDPEGDNIHYRLEAAPPGMTIEIDTGHIVWRVAPDLTGTYKVRVVAEDTQGATAFQEFSVTLTNPISAKAEGA
ncbi:MAG: putative Ig domain-containing protein [Nitrospirae bacterium]|nr:putative Ig domain-containing protein [Nitrospirota bacterium]